jgi:hypothetical protein
MEKVLLVASLFGTVHLFLLAVGRFGHLAFSPPMTKPKYWSGAVRVPEWDRSDSASSLASQKDGDEDWSKYDVPTFIRRGIPMPKLEVVPPKKPARRKKAVKKSLVEVATETEARFEVVL